MKIGTYFEASDGDIFFIAKSQSNDVEHCNIYRTPEQRRAPCEVRCYQLQCEQWKWRIELKTYRNRGKFRAGESRPG